MTSFVRLFETQEKYAEIKIHIQDVSNSNVKNYTFLSYFSSNLDSKIYLIIKFPKIYIYIILHNLAQETPHIIFQIS